MLTKWGAALGLASAGRVVAGGGGGPLGEATVWDIVDYWTDLGTIPGPLRLNDIVAVNDLVPGYGVAQYDGTDWRLQQAVFPTVADLLAFGGGGELIGGGALAIVGAGDETDPAYYYTGSAWARMADTVPFAWTLSSLTDFSAVGLQDGDYGVFTPSGGGPILVRYVAACAYRSGTGTGTRQIWVHPDIYGRANLQIEAYVVGTETAPAYGSSLQGYTYDRTNGGTITGNVSGYMRLDAPAPGSGNQFAFMTSPNISGAKRFYVRTELRGVTTGTLGQAGLFNLAAVIQSQWAVASQRNISTGAFLPIGWNQVGGTWDAALTGTAVRNGGNALPASTPWIVEGLSSGGAITDMMETRIDGLSYCSLRRNFDSATVSTNFNVVPFAGGNVGGASSGQLDIRNHYVLSSD
jgi:hypothetical protein